MLLVAFSILLCFRKVEDYYLKQTFGYLIAAMVMRLVICMIMVIIFNRIAENSESYQLLELQVSLWEYSIPVYFFLMVTIALLFSAHTFWRSLHEILVPRHLQKNANDDERDNAFQDVTDFTKLTNTWNKFWLLQSLIILVLAIYIVIVMTSHLDGVDSEINRSDWRAIVCSLCWWILFAVQVLVLVGALFVHHNLRELSRVRPVCSSGLCSETDQQMCSECLQLKQVLDQRLPIVLCAFRFCFIIQVVSLLTYSTQAGLNIFEKGGRTRYTVDPVCLSIEIILELIMSVSIFVAICLA